MATVEEGEIIHPLIEEGPHPLYKTWVLFFDGALHSGQRPGAQDWAKNMKRVAEFSTVEEFWGVINNVPPPSKLPVGCNYHLFRFGIMPMWEDGNNAKGGKWIRQQKRNAGLSDKCLDAMWLYTMLSLVGENYPEDDQICGAVCSLRQKQDRVAVWTRDAQNEDKYNPIGVIFRNALNDSFGDSGTKPLQERDLEYKPHDESLQKLVTGGKRR